MPLRRSLRHLIVLLLLGGVLLSGWLAYVVALRVGQAQIQATGLHRLELYTASLQREISKYAFLPGTLDLEKEVLALLAPDASAAQAEKVSAYLVWCLKSNHQIMVLAARATDAKMVSALLCHTNGLGSSL